MVQKPLLEALACDYFVLKLYLCPLLILPKGFMTIQSLEDYNLILAGHYIGSVCI